MIKALLTLTEVGMLLYWAIAGLSAMGFLAIPPDWMYSDYRNPVIIAWNWSFFPIDVIFAVSGLIATFGHMKPQSRERLQIFALTLMFCAGLMAISFWVIRGSFSPFWWGVNIWLMLLPCLTFASYSREKGD